LGPKQARHGRIWKWIQNNLEIYRNLERAICTSPVQKKQYPTQKKGFVYLKGNLSIGITFIPLSISLDSPFNGKKNVVSNAESWKVIKHKKDNNGNNSDQIRVKSVFIILIYRDPTRP